MLSIFIYKISSKLAIKLLRFSPINEIIFASFEQPEIDDLKVSIR